MLLGLSPIWASAPTPPERYAAHARADAALLRLSPEGTALWAQHILRAGDWREWRRLSEIEMLIGRQLALETPDRGVLDHLVEAYALESARTAQLRKRQTVSTALQLSAADRKAVGTFLKIRTERHLRPVEPDQIALPKSAAASIAANLYDLSPAGTRILAEAAHKAGEPARSRERIELAIGEELARDRADLATLDGLVRRYAAEEARFEQRAKTRLLETAFLLEPADRKRLAAFMTRSAAEALAGEKPVLEIVP
ncbi:MAG TPA: hypothetical protein VEZ70_10675 [Allosphingosinicella sp.]|nr:hypothetical protein [Allosphingosinicella sp.]